jgi:uncharacterized protein YcnI
MILVGVAGLCLAATAQAHIEADGPSIAGESNVVTFSVPHGCQGNDTYKLTFDIPGEMTSVRPMPSDLGTPTVVKDGAGAVTNVTWEKPAEDELDSDYAYYEVALRFTAPDTPFTTIELVAHQTCHDADGNDIVIDWDGVEEEAPAVTLLPAHTAGWNKYTVDVAIDDLAAYFADAQIVWKDSAAYSASEAVAELITNTADVSDLTAIAAGDEIWVKYGVAAGGGEE